MTLRHPSSLSVVSPTTEVFEAMMEIDLGSSPLWLRVQCLRCGRHWVPRLAAPKQCRWCKSRAWRSPVGSIPLGRPRGQTRPRIKTMRKR